ncbi:MAG: flagellar basal body P-ring formation chaperone FlgA [Gallionella sp.]|nr:flagellar basal body P-ring formation chaperone FlgA [Gallionella sp.]MDD4945742.1 flagellar basal body P-ring formation chaperone FlgA [Gallionella sp.]
MKKTLLTFCSLLACTLVHAAALQDRAALRAIVGDFVQQQTAALPGKVTFQVEELDSRINLQPCDKIEAFLPGGSKLAGRVSIGVRCNQPGGWRTFVPVQINIRMDLLTSSRPLTMGQIIHQEDLASQTVENPQSGGLTEASQVIGQVMRYSVSQGTVLRAAMMRAPYSIKQGQVVQLLIQGNGFTINGSGVALNNAAEGETVQIRTPSNRVISGIAAENGEVKITP